MEIDELQHLDKGEVIVLNDRCYPIRGYLKDYSEYCRLEKANGKPVAYYEHVPQYHTIDLLSKWKYPKELEEDMDKNQPGIIGYSVKEGETIWDIAKKYRCTIEDLKRTNELANGELSANQKLLVVKFL